MMRSTTFEQQTLLFTRGKSFFATTLSEAMDHIQHLRRVLESQPSVRPSIVLATIVGCLAAWGIAAICVAIG